MKTSIRPLEVQVVVLVYILPLRNENNGIDLWSISLEHSLYPTFKEWKPPLNGVKSKPNVVYILPLRNENQKPFGIGLNKAYVYILPLRNENSKLINTSNGLTFSFISYL